MSKKSWLGVEEAAGGDATVIVRHGKPIAALVPLDSLDVAKRQLSILPLVNSGHGLWGQRSGTTLRKLRDEWSR